MPLTVEHLVPGAIDVHELNRAGLLSSDWITLRLLRPRLPRVIYHWHASGLGSWIQSDARAWERALTLRWMARVDLSIVLSQFNRSDGEVLDRKSTRLNSSH